MDVELELEALVQAFEQLPDGADEAGDSALQERRATLHSRIVGLRLDALYADEPDARPSDDAVAAMAARAGLELP